MNKIMEFSTNKKQKKVKILCLKKLIVLELVPAFKIKHDCQKNIYLKFRNYPSIYGKLCNFVYINDRNSKTM